MANRLPNPDIQFADQNGLPYAGGTLGFFASGTSTPLSTFSDSGLSIANPNPVVLDSAGRAGSVFLQNLAYKVTLSDVNSNLIWTIDPVYTSDFSTVAAFLTNAGNPNGSVAGTAGSGTVPSSVIWDRTNNVLYVATTTGSSSTTVWTAVNPSAGAVLSLVEPQGYLGPDASNPIPAAGYGSGETNTAATALFYTPYVGNLIPIYNGSNFANTTFTQLTLTLNSTPHVADNIYDVFVFVNSGVVTIGTGPAWTITTPGASARGTGAGTTQIGRFGGINVNTNLITLKNGVTTFSNIPAQQATYVGTLWIDHTAAQITFNRNFGQNRKWGCWNAYNRVPLYLKAGDSTASWVYGVATVRASNNVPTSFVAANYNAGSGTSVNGLMILTGLAEENFTAQFNQSLQNTGGGSAGTLNNLNGIGLNSTTAFSGKQGTMGSVNVTGGSTGNGDAVASFFTGPVLGITTITALEEGQAGQPTTYFGTEAHMLLTAFWRG
jgi:hypothetical protein